MNEKRLSTHNLSKTYGMGDSAVYAVRQLELSVEPGEIVLLMGPSGSGKTTLLTLLGGLLRPTSGHVLIDSTDISRMAERKLQKLRATTFGFIFQDFNLLRSLTARQNVRLALEIAGRRGRVATSRVDELFALLGLDPRADFPVDQLSGGEKQRVAIARALANRPAVILADEPTANLDSANGAETMRLLRELAVNDGAAVVVASHDDRIRTIADRVLWLEDGTLRHMADLVTDPACGMLIDPGRAPAHLETGDRNTYFCSTGCRDQYIASLGQLAGATASVT